MRSVVKICAAATLLASLSSPSLRAADLAPAEPQSPPQFYVHAGALGVFKNTNAQSTGGGYFNSVTPLGGSIQNVVIRPDYTLGLEIGYFATPNIALALSIGVPPLAHFKGIGLFPATALGTDLLGSVRYGPGMALVQYHFTDWGPLQPYGGIGVGYVFDFGNISDGVLSNFSVDQNFAFVLQGGLDYMFTRNIGVYIDAKKIFYSTDVQGFVVGTNVPIRTHVQLDSWLIGTGVTFKF